MPITKTSLIANAVFVERTQLDDGSWSVPWDWCDYPEEWAVSKNWWKGNGGIQNKLFLKGTDWLS